MALQTRTEKTFQLAVDANYKIRAVFSPAPAPPAIALETSVTQLTIQPQTTGQLIATVTSQNNFSGQINLYFLDVKNTSGNSVTSLFTPTISPLTAAIGPTTPGQFNVSVTPTQAPAGTYILTLEARSVNGVVTPVRKDITIIIPFVDNPTLLISPPSASINVGQTVKLDTFIKGVDFLRQTTDVTWTISNTNIATIDSTGLVTGKTGGVVTATAKHIQYGQASAPITVIAPQPSVTPSPSSIPAPSNTPAPQPSVTPSPSNIIVPNVSVTPTPSKTPALPIGCRCYTATLIGVTSGFIEYVKCGELITTRQDLIENIPSNVCARIDTVRTTTPSTVSITTNNVDCTLNPNICQPAAPSPTPSPSKAPAPSATPSPSTTPGVSVTPSSSNTPAPSKTPSPTATPAASQQPLIPPSPSASPVPPPPSAIPPSVTPSPIPSRTPAPSPPPIITWRNCTDGVVREGTAPAGYREVAYSGAGGGTCWEPAGTIGFAPALNEVLTFVYQRGSSEYPQPKTVVATNPSYGITYRVTLQSNPNVLILPNSFIIPPRRDVSFTVNTTPILLQELGDGTSTLRMSVTIEEL